MGEKTISALEAKTQVLDTDLIAIDDGQNTYKITGAQLRSFLRVNSLPMGTVIYNQSKLESDMPGFLKGWTGGYYNNASSRWPDFYAWLKSHTELCTSKTSYDTILTEYGEVNMYVLDEEEGSIRLPIYRRFIRAVGVDGARGLGKDQIINITGTIVTLAGQGGSEMTGAFYNTGRTIASNAHSDQSDPVAGFDASRVVRTGDEVQPRFTKEYPWIAVYNYAVPSSIYDASQYPNLEQKPSINGVEIIGSKTAADYGLAPLDNNGKVPSQCLPSYVDDVINLKTLSDTPPAEGVEGEQYYDIEDALIYTYNGSAWASGETPEEGKIYIAVDNNKSYRWNNVALIEIAAGGSVPSRLTFSISEEVEGEGINVTELNTGVDLSSKFVQVFISGVLQTPDEGETTNAYYIETTSGISKIKFNEAITFACKVSIIYQ